MKKSIIVFIVLFIVAILIFTGMIPLLELFAEEDYNTGISRGLLNNCETEHKWAGAHEIFGERGVWRGNVVPDYEELIISPMNNEVIVTAMKSGEGKRSVEVSAYATIAYVGSKFVYWVPDWGWYEVDITYNGRVWENIINTKNGQIDESIISLFSGARSKQKYSKQVSGFGFSPIWGTIYEYKNLYPITFRIKDTQVGALRITQMTEFTALFGVLREEHVLSVDYAYLASGAGDVEIVDEMTVYEEGETIKFEVDTGFSGQTQAGEYVSKGWQLKIYDAYGHNRKMWEIDDDKRGARQDGTGSLLDYIIPSGSYNPEGSNTWKVVLTNTLFDQDEELFFAIGLGMREQAPSIPTVEFGEDVYRLGDNVYVTFTSTPNVLGRNFVDGFLVNVIYGKDGVDYVPGYQAKYVSAGASTATISFKTTKGDTHITVEAWAFDAPEGYGGIPSERGYSSVWIKDKQSEPIDMDITGIIVAAVIIILFAILALLVPVPIQFKIAIILAGVVVAVLVYVYFFTGIIA